MELVFGDAMNEPTTVIFSRESSYTTVSTRWDAFRQTAARADVFLSYSSNFPGKPPRKECVENIYALCVDLDYGQDLANLGELVNLVRHQSPLPPTFLNLGSGGVHVVFALKTPYPAQKRNHRAFDAIQRGLQDLFRILDDMNFRPWAVDHTWFGQPFRMPGCPTKLDKGTKVTAYRVGPQYSMESLAVFFKVELIDPDLPRGQVVELFKERTARQKAAPKPKTRSG